MGWITAIQPNGKICVLSTVVDGIIYDNLTDEEYIKAMGERAKENAERNARWDIEELRKGSGNFEQIKDGLYPDDETSIENIKDWLKSVGDPDWDKYDYDLPKC